VGIDTPEIESGIETAAEAEITTIDVTTMTEVAVVGIETEDSETDLQTIGIEKESLTGVETDHVIAEMLEMR